MLVSMCTRCLSWMGVLAQSKGGMSLGRGGCDKGERQRFSKFLITHFFLPQKQNKIKSADPLMLPNSEGVGALSTTPARLACSSVWHSVNMAVQIWWHSKITDHENGTYFSENTYCKHPQWFPGRTYLLNGATKFFPGTAWSAGGRYFC